MEPLSEEVNRASMINPSIIPKGQTGDSTVVPPKIVVPNSPQSTIGDDTSLNDDLLSISGSRYKNSSRRSVDSVSFRRSFESSATGRNGRSFGFSNDIHSGSQDYSPLGNNSIYEVVMNTRNKNWLGYPTSYDIPPVVLSKNDIDPKWRNQIKHYSDSIKSEYSIFESTNNLRNMNRLEQIKQLETYNASNLELNTEDLPENEENFLYKQNEINKEIEEVPEFYFDKEFQLDNPRTFRRVLEGINLNLNKLDVSSESDRTGEFTNLNDKLNDYLDSVENLLVTEISKSSHKFFHALGNVDQIQEKVNNSIVGLDQLTNVLEEIDKNKVQRKIENMQKLVKERNIEKLEQCLLQVKITLIKTEECRELYSLNEYDTCMRMINSIDNLIRGDNINDVKVKEWTEGWPYKLSNLKAVPSILDTRELLTNLKIEIGGKFALQLCDNLISDLREYCASNNGQEILDRLQGKSREKRYLQIDSELQSTVAPLIRKLFKCEELTSAFSVYQDRIIAELKSIIKIYLPQEHHIITTPSAEDISSQVKPGAAKTVNSGSKLSKLIKEQTPHEFQDMLVNTFTQASEALRRLYRHQKLLLDISLNEIMTAENSNKNEHEMITQLDIRNGINEGIRIVQLRMGKIIVVRRDLSSQLRYDHFLHLYAVCVLFIQECEAVSGEFLTKYLSDVLSSQIRHYINTRNAKDVRLIKNKLDVEKWVPFIVDPSIQKDVNDLVSSMELDPLDWTSLIDIHISASEVSSSGKVVNNVINDANNETEKVLPATGHRKSVVVGDKTFVASGTLISMITMIKEILVLSTNLPNIYVSSFEKILFEILRSFNMNVMSIISDPSKKQMNLSIMGESLDCLVEFIKIIQRFYRRLSSSNRDYEHIDAKNQQHAQVDYIQLLKMYDTTLEKIYLANAPPSPS